MVSLRKTFQAHLSLVYLQKKTDTTGVCFTLQDLRALVCTEDMFILLGSSMNLVYILGMLRVLHTLQGGSL